jgi:RNA polymerase sigma-70 factor (ECF subfamily)
MATVTVRAQPKTTEEKFDELFHEHSDLIYNAAFAITANEYDAEDALQTIGLRLIRMDLSDELLSHPKAYLHRAAVNEALSIVRSRQRRKEVPFIVEDDDGNERECDDVVRKFAAAHREMEPQRRLLEAIALLETDDVALLLLYCEGHTEREIAEIYGERQGTVSSKLSRAREKLRKLMIEEAS